MDDFIPLLIRAGGISALPVRQLITQLRLNRALKGDYHRAVVNVTSVKKKTSAGEAYTLHPKIVRLITDERKATELKEQSIKLLGAPIPLPEGRPEDEAEREPLGFTPKGVPFYSEEEKIRLMEPKVEPEETAGSPLAEEPLKAKEPLALDLDI